MPEYVSQQRRMRAFLRVQPSTIFQMPVHLLELV